MPSKFWSQSNGHLSVHTKYSSQPYLTCWEYFSLKCSHPLASVISYSLCFLSTISFRSFVSSLASLHPLIVSWAFCPWPCVSALCFIASLEFQTVRYKCLQNFSTWHPAGSSEIISKAADEPYTAPSPQKNNHHNKNDRNLSKQTTSCFSSGISHFSKWHPTSYSFSSTSPPLSYSLIARNYQKCIGFTSLYVSYILSISITRTRPAQSCYCNNLTLIFTLFPLIHFPYLSLSYFLKL